MSKSRKRYNHKPTHAIARKRHRKPTKQNIKAWTLSKLSKQPSCPLRDECKDRKDTNYYITQQRQTQKPYKQWEQHYTISNHKRRAALKLAVASRCKRDHKMISSKSPGILLWFKHKYIQLAMGIPEQCNVLSLGTIEITQLVWWYIAKLSSIWV